MYLLDTNIISELRRTRPHGAVLAWLRDIVDSDLHLSAVTIGELQAGIEMAREQNSTKASELQAWLDRVVETYNVIPMDGPAFRIWASLMHRKSEGLIEDAMIAATARLHGLTVVTRNVRDFAIFEVPTLNPFLNQTRS